MKSSWTSLIHILVIYELSLSNIASQHKDALIFAIKKYWDIFCKEGARRTILDYEFSIDTTVSKPVFLLYYIWTP